MRHSGYLCALSLLLAKKAGASDEEEAARQRSLYYKKWRTNPKMVVFGDSNADSGRRFNAPASFDFEGIGPFPWTRLFDAPDSDSKSRVYLPSPGSATNGKVWPDWLRIPQEYNFATSSGSITETFRSQEDCLGYTGEGEDFPTATLDEQITRYIYEVLDHTDETLDYTHVILLGGNDLTRVGEVIQRYTIAATLFPDGSYVDPVPAEAVFDDNGEPTFAPLIAEILSTWAAAVDKLITRGVTGKILIGNIPSFKGVPVVIASGQAELLDAVALATNAAAQPMFEANPQLLELDMYSLSAAIADNPELFTDEGFSTRDGLSLGFPCLDFDFAIDSTAEIMGTQALRAAGCQETCGLCADSSSPCSTCFEGNPSATICDDPDSSIFWDIVHFTTRVHELLGEAIRQCSKDAPNYERAWVGVLCPSE